MWGHTLQIIFQRSLPFCVHCGAFYRYAHERRSMIRKSLDRIYTNRRLHLASVWLRYAWLRLNEWCRWHCRSGISIGIRTFRYLGKCTPDVGRGNLQRFLTSFRSSSGWWAPNFGHFVLFFMYGTNMNPEGVFSFERAGTVLAAICRVVLQMFALNVCCSILTTSVHSIAYQAFPLGSGLAETTGNVLFTLSVVICNVL